MSARRTPQVARGSSFRAPSWSADRLEAAFKRVRKFVARKFPQYARAKLHIGCLEIAAFRRENKGYTGNRAFMHVGHRRGTICSSPWAASLASTTLFAMFLHEFGHFGGRMKEPEANEWVKKNFGIRIKYKGPLDLQWVDPFVVKRVVAGYSSSS